MNLLGFILILAVIIGLPIVYPPILFLYAMMLGVILLSTD